MLRLDGALSCLALAEPAGIVADAGNHRAVECDIARRSTRSWAE